MDEGRRPRAARAGNRPIVPAHVDAHLETGGPLIDYWTVRDPHPPKVDIQYPCPGLCRFTGFAAFCGVAFVTYRTASAWLGLVDMDWSAPHWTASRVLVVVSGVALASVGGIVDFGLSRPW